jgi:hypothetical protein
MNFGSGEDIKLCQVNLILLGPMHITKLQSENLKARDLLKDVGIDGRIIFK